MTDIASLGLAVNSEQVERARDELNRFVTVAKTAERATKQLETTTRSAGSGAGSLGEQYRRLGTSADAINKRLNVRDDFDARSRGEDVEAYGRHLDDLRAKFSPLYAAQRQHLDMTKAIAAAQAFGAISQLEASMAIKDADNKLRLQTLAIERNNAALAGTQKSAALSAQSMANLSFQINDVATMAAMGADPLRILASQGGQFYQVLAEGEGGVRGSLTYIGQTIRGFITPFRLATAGALSFVGAGVAAASSWRSAQHEINLALIGTGSVAGITSQRINDISFAAADAGRATVGEARQMALAFASTGKIGDDLTESLVNMSRGFGKLYGEEATEGAARLARIFADPAKGVDDLNKRLSVFDAATVDRIKRLTDQGRRIEAQTMLIDGMKTSIAQASAETSGWANAWNRLTATTSEFWARAGRALDLATGGSRPGLEGQLQDAREAYETALRTNARGPQGSQLRDREIARTRQELERLEEVMQRVRREEASAPANMRSNQYADSINAAVPDVRALKEARDELQRLQNIMRDPAGFQGLPRDQQQAIDRAIQARREEVEGLQVKLDAQRSSLEMAKQDHAFSMLSIEARTAAQRAEVAYMQTRERERRAGNPNFQLAAENARAQVLAEEQRAVGDELRSRNLAAQQAVDMARLELSLVGKTADEQARIRAAFEARQQVEIDAALSFRTPSQREIQEAESMARLRADLESAARRKEIETDLDFERAQFGRSETEQAVYSRMQAAGLLENGQIGQQNELTAARIRFNEQLQRSVDVQREFAGSFLRDVQSGKGALEALGNALDGLASRMLDNSVNLLFSGLASGGGITTGGLLGGNILPGIFHDGGTVTSSPSKTRSVPASVFASAPRFHAGANLGADEVPAILQTGERVLSRREVAAINRVRKQSAAAAPSATGTARAGAGGGVTISMPVSINAAGAYPESIEDIKRALNTMPGQIMRAVADNRDRGLI